MVDTHQPDNRLPENRRQFLVKGLAAVSGLTFGYSLIGSAWAADVKLQKSNLKIAPAATAKLREPGHLTMQSAKLSQTARQITPTLKELLTNAGLKISPGEMNALQQAFEQRGTIHIPGGRGDVASTLTIGGSVTWQ